MNTEGMEKIREQGINRYIVGCKFLILTIGQPALKRINRYIVGCKL